jgi:hypothetical protein
MIIPGVPATSYAKTSTAALLYGFAAINDCYLSAYYWNAAGNSFGPRVSNESPTPMTFLVEADMRKQKDAVVFGGYDDQALRAKRFSLSGWGTDYATVYGWGYINAVTFNPQGNWIAFNDIFAYWKFIFISFDINNGFGTVGSYNNVEALLNENIFFSPDGSKVLISTGGAPFIQVFPFNSANGTIGTAYAAPLNPPPNYGTSGWSPNGNTIFSTNFDPGGLRVYPFSSSTGFGTKYADPLFTAWPRGSSGFLSDRVFIHKEYENSINIQSFKSYPFLEGVGFQEPHIPSAVTHYANSGNVRTNLEGTMFSVGGYTGPGDVPRQWNVASNGIANEIPSPSDRVEPKSGFNTRRSY